LKWILPAQAIRPALAATLALMRLLQPAGVSYLIIAVGIVLGSVRGRYHYLLDAVAGVVVAVASYLAWILV
jgi:hypothetical protein